MNGDGMNGAWGQSGPAGRPHGGPCGGESVFDDGQSSCENAPLWMPPGPKALAFVMLGEDGVNVMTCVSSLVKRHSGDGDACAYQALLLMRFQMWTTTT